MKRLIYVASIILASYSCEKTVPPQDCPLKSNIISPIDNRMYDEKILPIEWHYEGNVMNAWIRVNDGEKFPISCNDGSLNWGFKDGINKVVLGVEDNTHVKKDSVSFCAGHLIK